MIIAEADGSMLCAVSGGLPRKGTRPRAWPEIRLLASQPQGSVATTCAATFGSVQETGVRWGHTARAAGRGLASRIHAVCDGAEWIARQTREVFGADATLLTDFYHGSASLAALAAELPIGSGLIEAGHKHVLPARLKISGAAWLPSHAESMAQLRVLRSNDRWSELRPLAA